MPKLLSCAELFRNAAGSGADKKRINELTNERSCVRCFTTGHGMAGRINLRPPGDGPTGCVGWAASWLTRLVSGAESIRGSG